MQQIYLKMSARILQLLPFQKEEKKSTCIFVNKYLNFYLWSPVITPHKKIKLTL